MIKKIGFGSFILLPYLVLLWHFASNQHQQSRVNFALPAASQSRVVDECAFSRYLISIYAHTSAIQNPIKTREDSSASVDDLVEKLELFNNSDLMDSYYNKWLEEREQSVWKVTGTDHDVLLAQCKNVSPEALENIYMAAFEFSAVVNKYERKKLSTIKE